MKKIIKDSNFIFKIIFILTILIFFFSTYSAQAASWQDFMNKITTNPGGIKPGDITTGVASFTTLILDFVLGIAVLFLIIGGYQYMTAVGRPERIQKAKETVTYSIVGIIITGLAGSITRFVTQKVQGAANINDLITRLIDASLLFFGGLAVLVIVYGGIRYITSTGDPEQIKKARDIIQYGVIGTIIIILSSAIAKFAKNKFANNPPLEGVINTLINVLLSVAGTLAVLFLIIGGYQYITSLGNPEQISKAKSSITYSIIGLIIVILSYVIVKFVFNIF